MASIFFETVPIELDVLAAASRIALKYIEFIYIPITIFVNIPRVCCFVSLNRVTPTTLEDFKFTTTLVVYKFVFVTFRVAMCP